MNPDDTGPREPREILDAARAAAERGDYQQAAALYSRAVGNPNPTVHVAALLGLADSRYRLDDEEGALQSWIVATQAPETPLTWQAWVQLAGARVRQGDLVGAARAYREAEQRAPADEKAGIQSRLGWLNKEMGNTGAAQRYFGRARPGNFTPIVTYAIIAITAAVSLYTIYAPGQTSTDLFNLLLLDKQAVMHGEYWRLLTVTLVHGGLLHLLLNMYALWIIGPLAEALYGRSIYLGAYLLAGIGGSVASYLFSPSPAVGASGAIFGIFGLVFASSYFHRPALSRQARALTGQLGIVIVLNLLIGFTPGLNIDWMAHVGGLIVGAWLGFAITPRGAATLASLWQRPATPEGQVPSRTPGLLPALGILLVVVVLFVALQITPTWA